MRRLTALCLLACAVVMIGLALAGVLQQIRVTRAPVVVVTRCPLSCTIRAPCPERNFFFRLRHDPPSG
jgi:hypothetical protein